MVHLVIKLAMDALHLVRTSFLRST